MRERPKVPVAVPFDQTVQDAEHIVLDLAQRKPERLGAVGLGFKPARAVDILHMDVLLGGGDLAQDRHLARQAVDVLHGEVDATLLRGGENMQNGVGRAAHRDVEGHSVFKGFLGGDVARQD